MRVTIRRIGNSKGIVIPEVFLAQLGLRERADVAIEGDALVIRKAAVQPRAGWAAASKVIACAKDDVLVLGEFANRSDDDVAW
jgi:antitoxin MazE